LFSLIGACKWVFTRDWTVWKESDGFSFTLAATSFLEIIKNKNKSGGQI